MGIRIKSKSDIITVKEFVDFLYHLDNIYKAEVLLLQHKEYNSSNFHKIKLKHSESLFIGPISKQSPFDLTLVPTITYDGMASIIFGIIQTIIAVKLWYRDKNKENKIEENETKKMIKIELTRRQIKHDDIIVEETAKITLSGIEIDSAEIVDKTFSDYFGDIPREK